MERKQVVIVGAGVSGLAAASALSTDDNFDVTLLEAEDRVGGRIHTIDYNGEKIELGAKWIHGKQGNAIYELLSKHLDPSAFQFVDERYEAIHNSYTMFTSGNRFTSEAEEFFHSARNLLYSIECDIKDNLQSGQITENELKDISVKDYARKIWDKEYSSRHSLDISQSEAIWTNLMAMMAVVDGAHPDASGCLLYNYYKEIDVDVVLHDSFPVLLGFLQKSIPKSSIKLNSKVKGINWKKYTTTFPFNQSSKPISKINVACKAEYSNLNSSIVRNGIGQVMHNGVGKCMFQQDSGIGNNTAIFKAKPTVNYLADLSASQTMQVAKSQIAQLDGERELNNANSCKDGKDTMKCQIAESRGQNVSDIAKSDSEKLDDTMPEHHNMSQQNGNLAESENQDKVRVCYTDESGCSRFMDADHVIVTVSLGVLKKYHEDLFTPNLPIQQQECIEKMGFGVVGKLFIHFHDKIWDQSDFALYLLCDSDYEDSDRRSWCKELDLVEIFNGCTLIVWLNKIALEKIKNITKDEIWQHLYDIIKGHCCKTIPTPDDIFVTQWGENENFLGSYSYTALGETGETRKIACKPLHINGIPKIMFAGEAFHESRFGTVDGAYLTGLREAKRVVQCYQSMK